MTALVWLRQDLRLHDNEAVKHASENHEQVALVVALSPVQWQQHDWAPIKLDLYIRRVEELSKESAELGVQLHVLELDSYRDIPAAMLKLARSLNAQHLYFNRDYPLDERRRDQAVVSWLERHEIQCKAYDSTLLVRPESVKTGQGTYYKKFTPFFKQWREVLHQQGVSQPYRLTSRKRDASPVAINIEAQRRDSTAWHVDSKAIDAALQEYLRARVERYHQDRDTPAIEGTTRFSPYFENGSLGVATVARALSQLSPDFPHGLSEGPSTWLSELAWREFYMHLMWHVPRLSYGKAFQIETDQYPWKSDEALFNAWCEGKTGFPIVDAGMRQLAHEGWMHNRVRMIVSSFLVKDLGIDWRKGEKFFMQHLIDGSFAANNGGWQWSASTGTDAVPYFRVFNPERQSERFDPAGHYIRKWVHELEKVPSKAIHAPHIWLSQYDRSNQYPKPMVDHKEAREAFIATFKKVKNG
ncbi:MAG: deoxyribodipyrimidine photo-lyase [Idiomarina sp.]|nr:deoxyribodipyrimidine photo-lyase [Idiomarina sp.]